MSQPDVTPASVEQAKAVVSAYESNLARWRNGGEYGDQSLVDLIAAALTAAHAQGERDGMEGAAPPRGEDG